MGRNKIKIEKISNERNRQVNIFSNKKVTYYKRKKGLLKKAMELSVLCGVKVLLCIVDKRNKVNLFSSEKLEKFISEYLQEKVRSKNQFANDDYQRLFRKKGKSFAQKNLNSFNNDKKVFTEKIKNKISKFCKKSEDDVEEEDDNIKIVNILENSMDSMYLPPSILMEKEDKAINDRYDTNDNLFLNNSTFHDDPIKELSIIQNNEENSFSCFSVSSSRKTKKENFSLNESTIENKIIIDKETSELDSTNNISGSNSKTRSLTKFSRSKFSSLGEKKKKSKFLCIKELNIKEDIEKSAPFHLELLDDKDEIETQEKNDDEINLETDINQPIPNKNYQDLKSDIGSYIGLSNQGYNESNLSQSLLKLQGIIDSTTKKNSSDQQFINHKHFRDNDLQNFNDYINNVNTNNNTNYINQANDYYNLSPLMSEYLANNYIGNSNNNNNINFYNEYLLNYQLIKNMMGMNNNNLINQNNFYSINYQQGQMDNNDVRILKDLEKLYKFGK